MRRDMSAAVDAGDEVPDAGRSQFSYTSEMWHQYFSISIVQDGVNRSKGHVRSAVEWLLLERVQRIVATNSSHFLPRLASHKRPLAFLIRAETIHGGV